MTDESFDESTGPASDEGAPSSGQAAGTGCGTRPPRPRDTAWAQAGAASVPAASASGGIALAAAHGLRALNTLLEGNAWFASGRSGDPWWDERKRTNAVPERRPVAVLACADSPLPAETLFDHANPDLLTVNRPGREADADALGRLEYAVATLGCPLVVVLGHDQCGPIGGAWHTTDGAGGQSHRFRPAAAVRPSGRCSDAVVDDEVRRRVGLLLRQCPRLATEVAEGRATVVGLAYRRGDARVRTVTAHGPVHDVYGGG
ncbi:carbonic anhydrase [Kitasatospora sp. NPDC093806]|uniref:carbonic anhydrase n=1 Tax=Kitasatospora sp. NPDC093806 TaxID=3155075 RepID=UPI003418E669